MGSDKELRYRETWNGKHRGVAFQVSKHIVRGLEGIGRSDYPVWCYYLLIGERQVPAEKHPAFFLEPKISRLSPESPERIHYDYYSAECAFSRLDSWHGGITYYDYLEQTPGHRVVKVGCDWNHAWDNAEYDPYSLLCVESECRATVDELWEQHPDLLVHCGWTGKFFPLAEMEPWGERGGYISPEGRVKRDESKKRRGVGCD